MAPTADDMPSRRRFDNRSLRILKEAMRDAGYALLRPRHDLDMLLTFLERFDRLGWFPPVDLEKRRVLAAHDVIIHVIRGEDCFYEFCSKGARGERRPWLSIFFHVARDARVRICGIERTDWLQRHRNLVLERTRLRVEILSEWLNRREEF